MRVDSYFNFPHYRRRNSLNERTERVKLNLSANKSFIKSTQGKLASVDCRNVAARAAKIPCESAIIFEKKEKKKKKNQREREEERDTHPGFTYTNALAHRCVFIYGRSFDDRGLSRNLVA